MGINHVLPASDSSSQTVPMFGGEGGRGGGAMQQQVRGCRAVSLRSRVEIVNVCRTLFVKVAKYNEDAKRAAKNGSSKRRNSCAHAIWVLPHGVAVPARNTRYRLQQPI